MNRIARLSSVAATLVVVAAGLAYTWSAPASPGVQRRLQTHHHPASKTMTMAMAMAMAMDMTTGTASATPMDMTTVTTGMPHGVSMPEHGSLLPPGTEHGLAHRLRQYPAVFLATAMQRAAAERLRTQLLAAARRWASPRAAAAAGFDLRRAHRAPGERRVMWFHSENRRWHAARGASLDPSHPDTLIYADLPGRPLRLVGVMISMPRGLRGPTPGGPITRWHYHLVCVTGDKRGLAPRRDGSCPASSKLGVGSEMMHIWFTRDLRSAYAVHAPWPELCAARLLPAATCASGERFVGM